MAEGRKRALATGIALLLLALVLFASTGRAQSQSSAEPGADETESYGVQNPRVVTEYGEVTAMPSAARSAECHRQNVTMKYEDAPNKPFITFTGVKRWCYNGTRVTSGSMDVETWIRPDSRYGPGRDGYRYAPAELKKTDRFLTYNGRRYGAHESVRIGRFEYRAHGFDRAAQVLNPYVSRTGRYNGACDGPRPKDASPRVGAVKPAGGAKNVPPSANVEAAFNRNMGVKAVNGSTFQLVKRDAFDPVSASIRYDATKRKATLNPSRRLAPGTYTATVFAGPFGVLTSEGDPIASSKVWSFTVGR